MVEISELECFAIVRKASGKKHFKVINCTTERFGDHLGYLGEYYRLKIKIQCNGDDIQEFQFFVKSLPIVDIRGRREMLIETGIFHKEMKIFEKLLLKFLELDNDKIQDKLWCPTIYLIHDDFIVFNDLNLLNYRILPFETFDFPQQHMEATLSALSHFHACSIVFEIRENLCIGDEFKDILFETSVTDIPWFTIGLDIIQHIAETEFGVRNSEAFYKKIFNVIEVMENSPFDVPKVLCHRDLWKNNLMFHDNPLNCVLIDFQTARYLSLSVDVTMAIICLARRDHYEMMMDYYLLYYYQHLAHKLAKYSINLDNLMDYESYIQSCNYHKQVSLVYKTLVVTETQVPHELFDDFSKEDHVEYLGGDRYSFVKKFMEADELFKERLLESVKAVVDEFEN